MSVSYTHLDVYKRQCQYCFKQESMMTVRWKMSEEILFIILNGESRYIWKNKQNLLNQVLLHLGKHI